MKRCIAGLIFGLMLGLASGQAKGDVTDGLVGRWELDGNGSDSSGLNHNGIVHEATATTDRFGHANSALLFDGSSAYVAVADHSDLRPTDAITFTAWFNPTSFNLGNYSWPAILKKATSNQSDGYGLETLWVYESSPEMSAYVALPSAVPQAHLPIATDTWYFAAGVYDGSNLSLYLGQSDLQTLAVNSLSGLGAIQQSLGELWIGADPSNPGSARSFNGAIDDVRIYNRALSAEEINQVFSVPEPSAVVLLLAGMVGFLAYAWRRRRSCK
jgi:hypothetical protein